MLYAIDGSVVKRITTIPHLDFYEPRRRRLSHEQLAAMWDELNRRVGDDEIHTAAWMPGSNWRNTPFQPIYEVACDSNYEESGRFFGILVWHVVLDRSEAWSFGRYEKDGVPIQSMTYFRVPNLD